MGSDADARRSPAVEETLEVAQTLEELPSGGGLRGGADARGAPACAMGSDADARRSPAVEEALEVAQTLGAPVRGAEALGFFAVAEARGRPHPPYHP
eukprot:6715054-Pyramimonas_sp.AAC.1